MKFGLFYQLPCAPSQDEPTRYEETLEQIVFADQLGFDVAWMAELHFYRAFSIMPAPLMVAVAAAQRTKRIRLGCAVVLLPFHNPVRTAEEVAVADVLTGGRLELGLGRGTIDLHFQGFDVPRRESRERFEEALELLELAFNQERFSFSGRFHSGRNIMILPRPLQKPRPPIRIAANSLETAEFAARRGYGAFVASPINPLPRFYEHAAVYRRALGAGAAGDLAALFPVFIAAGASEARRAVEASVLHYFKTIAEQAELGGKGQADADHAYLRELVERMSSMTYERIDEEMAVYGTPAYALERIAQLAGNGVDQLVCWFNPGGLVPHRDVLASMELFAREVMPLARRFGPVREITSGLKTGM